MSRQLQPAPGFTLICTICGNNRPFSDLSHTLTHLNSRGHLQQKHKLELQAPADPSIQARLDIYNIWYTTNNIATLLAERMSMPKGAKKSNKGKQTKSKDEIKADETSQPDVAVKRTRQIRDIPQYDQQGFDDDSDQDPSWHEDQPSTPVNKAKSRVVSGYIPVMIPIDPMLSEPTTSGRKVKGGGPLDLKGLVHEGMAVFDSATPQTKKARNQRKRPEVLQQMKKNSAEVVAAEISYHPNGEFRGVRDIFGPISTETTPVRKVPSAKKRGARSATKNVLQLKTVNRQVRVNKNSNSRAAWEFSKGTQNAAKRSMSTQPNYSGTNYLNQDMISQLGNSGPMLNPFGPVSNFASNYGVSRGTDNDYKPEFDRSMVPGASSGYEPEYTPMFENPSRYGSGPSYSSRYGETRGANSAGGFANPLSSAFVNYGQRSSVDEPQLDNHTSEVLRPSFDHPNEENVLPGSPTPVPRPIRLKDSGNETRSLYTPQPRFGPPSPKFPQFPKAGIFRTAAADGRTDQFQYRAYPNDNYRPTASMTSDHLGTRGDQDRNVGLSRQIASPRDGNVNLPVRQQTPLASQYKPTPIPSRYVVSSGRSRGFGPFPNSDRDIKSTPRNTLPTSSSALRSSARSPSNSSPRRSLQSAPRSLYGAELDQDYDDHFHY